MPPKTQSEKAAVFEEKLASLEARFEKIEAKVDEMHNVLMQAKGARWAILAAAGLAGFLSAKVAPLFSWIVQTPTGVK
jgi:hypothetical protein